jgi:hypothetical protein
MKRPHVRAVVLMMGHTSCDDRQSGGAANALDHSLEKFHSRPLNVVVTDGRGREIDVHGRWAVKDGTISDMPPRFRNYWVYSLSFGIAWASGTVARYAYPPPSRWLQRP